MLDVIDKRAWLTAYWLELATFSTAKPLQYFQSSDDVAARLRLNRWSSDLTARALSTKGRRADHPSRYAHMDSHAGTAGSATTPPPSLPWMVPRPPQPQPQLDTIWACDDRHPEGSRTNRRSQLPYQAHHVSATSPPCTVPSVCPWNLAPEPPGCRGHARARASHGRTRSQEAGGDSSARAHGDRQQPRPPGRAWRAGWGVARGPRARAQPTCVPSRSRP
jgi:hypothetical protein